MNFLNVLEVPVVGTVDRILGIDENNEIKAYRIAEYMEKFEIESPLSIQDGKLTIDLSSYDNSIKRIDDTLTLLNEDVTNALNNSSTAISTANSVKQYTEQEIPKFNDFLVDEQSIRLETDNAIKNQIKAIENGFEFDLNNETQSRKLEDKRLEDLMIDVRNDQDGLNNRMDEIQENINNLPDLTNLATKTELSKESQDRIDADKELSNKIESELSLKQDKGDYALKSEIPDLSGLATKEELSNKQDTLISGSNIKTINGESVLGEGNIEITGGEEIPFLYVNFTGISGRYYYTGSYEDVYNSIVNNTPFLIYIGKDVFDSVGVVTENVIEAYSHQEDLIGVHYVNKATFRNTGECDIFRDIINHITESQLNNSLITKQDLLVSGTNIKTINGESLLGSGNISTESIPYFLLTVNETSFTKGDYNLLSDCLATNKPFIVEIIDTTLDLRLIAEAVRNGNEITILAYYSENNLIYQAYCAEDNSVIWNTVQKDYVTEEQVNSKQDQLVSGESIKTINGESILGSGDIQIQGSSGESIPVGIIKQTNKQSFTFSGDYSALYNAIKNNTPFELYLINRNLEIVPYSSVSLYGVMTGNIGVSFHSEKGVNTSHSVYILIIDNSGAVTGVSKSILYVTKSDLNRYYTATEIDQLIGNIELTLKEINYGN